MAAMMKSARTNPTDTLSTRRRVKPAKLFEYLYARRPILFIGYEHGIAAQLVRERNAGLVSNHPEQIRDQSQTWIEDKQTGRFKRLDPFVSRGLSRDEQYQKLERLFAEILCHSGPLASHPAAG